MDIHDPHANIKRPLDDCETVPHVNGLIPIKSTKDDQWFAVCMISGESRKLEDLEGEDLRAVREAITTHRFTKLLLDRCHQAQGQEGTVDKGHAVLAAYGFVEQYGGNAVEAAGRSAVAAGFTRDVIARAYLLLESEVLLKDIPVTRADDPQGSEGDG